MKTSASLSSAALDPTASPVTSSNYTNEDSGMPKSSTATANSTMHSRVPIIHPFTAQVNPSLDLSSSTRLNAKRKTNESPLVSFEGDGHESSSKQHELGTHTSNNSLRKDHPPRPSSFLSFASLEEKKARNERKSTSERPKSVSKGKGGQRNSHEEKPKIHFSCKETWRDPNVVVFSEARAIPSYVAKSAFCASNPFRVQSFTEFVINPIYDPPRHLKNYKALKATTEMEEVQVGNADSVQLVKARIKQVSSIPFHPVGKATLDEMIVFMCAGELFFKWNSTLTSDNKKFEERYFWLDGKQCSLMWALPGVIITFSQLQLRTVVKITTDCISVGDRVLYRMILHGKKKLVLGTPQHILFDQWFAVLDYLISPNASHGAPGLWQRPSDLPITHVGRWEARYSPLDAEIIEAKNNEPRRFKSSAWTD